jgi:radical SAM-linked protein
LKSDFDSSILPLVARPNRYFGRHSTADPARFDRARLTALVVHPELFEVALGDAPTRGAWRALSAAPGLAADLLAYPWPDGAAELARRPAAPWGLESGRPLDRFDCVVLVPATALEAINVLTLFDRAGLAPRAADRPAGAPLVVLAGPLAAHPGALAEVVDAAFPGDPEVALNDLAARLESAAAVPLAVRRAAARAASGAWWPDCAGPIRAVRLAPGEAPLEEPALVPLAEIDREGLLLDIRRGGLGRRFEWGAGAFQAAWNRPVAEAVAACERGLAESGFDRVELCGDDPAAHPELLPLTEALVRRFPAVRVALADFGTREPGPALARELLRGRKAGLSWTIPAPGTRLAAVLNAPFDEGAFLAAVSVALKGGGGPLRLRFGIGWPTETDDDLEELVRLVRKVRALAASAAPSTRLSVTLDPFVPRPHTPFEWESVPSAAEFARRVALVVAPLDSGAVAVRAPGIERALFEAALARADGVALEWLLAARRAGASLPTPMTPWNGEPWRRAFAETGVDPLEGLPTRDETASRPWGGIVSGLPLDVLRRERDRARAGQSTPSAELAAEAARAVETRPAIRLAAVPDGEPVGPGEEGAGYGRRGRRRLAAASRPAARYRLRFAKEEPLRFTSHLDIGRAVERGLRRLALTSLAWRGRSVKLSFGPPLPLGWTGADEYLDLQFADEVAESLPQALAPVLPPGLVLLDVRPIRASVESLSHSIDRMRIELAFPPAYLEAAGGVDFTELRARLEAGAARFLASPAWMIPKSAGDELNRIDIRPGVLDVRVGTDAAGAPFLALHLTLGQPGSVRPEVLLPELLGGQAAGGPGAAASPQAPPVAADPRLARIHRTELRIAGNGREFTPLEVVELDFPWWREASRRTAAGRGSQTGA